jgi:hypothetical protein
MDTSNLWQPALMSAYGPTKLSQEIAETFWASVSEKASEAQKKEVLNEHDRFALAVATGVPFRTETVCHEDGWKVYFRIATVECNFVRDPDQGWVCYYRV